VQQADNCFYVVLILPDNVDCGDVVRVKLQIFVTF